ncbi:MAG: quinohemoprotein amine dehydrogenase subunit alpha [Deltaproteobacteria bacterium]|nr:quinohemoprotein amine dehydrogenase subunit alpha [Deltaproteobacteria bacterium]
MNMRKFWFLILGFSLLWPSVVGLAEELSGAALVQSRCAMCHAAESGGKLEAIATQRKTPEGWEMTLDRMMRMHGLRLQPGEGGALVKYLSDHSGLAPSEIGAYRYALEKRTSTVVSTSEIPKIVQGACLACHSYARIALQRRTPEAWRRMVDTKLALFTNTENVTASSGMLNSFWYDDAVKDAIPFVAKHFPLATEAWKKWHAAAKPNYAGTWKVVGHDAGKGGDYTGQLTLKASGGDRYEGEFTHEFADGSKISGKTTAILYTGFQWRGLAQVEGGQRQQEIFFGSEDGATLSGRRLSSPLGDIGSDETLYKQKDAARLLTMSPTAVKAGGQQRVKLFGMSFPSGLTSTAVHLGDGVKVQSLTQNGNDSVIVNVTTEKSAKVGVRQVKIDGVAGDLALQVYRTIDHIRLSPEHGFARPGGIKARKAMEQFEVIGYSNGKDGVKGTADDVKLGRVAPVKWNVEENVTRNDDDDVRFVGQINEQGLFTPADDGPNAKRERSEHNVGDIWIEAWYTPEGAKRPMGVRTPMLVMPEKFSFQPIE